MQTEDDFWATVRAERPDPPGAAAVYGSGHAARLEWFDAMRSHANTVPCRDCKQPVGASCVDAKASPPRPLTRFPSHTRRWQDADANAGIAR